MKLKDVTVTTRSVRYGDLPCKTFFLYNDHIYRKEENNETFNGCGVRLPELQNECFCNDTIVAPITIVEIQYKRI